MLTKSDKFLIDSALLFWDTVQRGIGPRRGGQFKQFRKLEKMGLLEFHGVNVDKVSVYTLTASGANTARK